MTKGMILALLAAFAWGSAIVMSKLSLDALAPAPLFFYQVASAAAVSWLVLLAGRKPFPCRLKNLPAYATGVFEPFLAYLLTLYGLTQVHAGIASVIYSLESVFILILSVVFLRMKVAQPARFGLLLLAAMAGSLMAVLPDTHAAGGGSISGYVLVAAGVFSAAVYVVISARLVENAEPLALLTGQLTFCTILSALYLLLTRQPWTLPFQAAALVAVSGIVQYFLAFFLWLHALRHVAVHLAGITLYFIPVIALVLSWLFLGETVNAVQTAGIALTIATVFVLNRQYGSE